MKLEISSYTCTWAIGVPGYDLVQPMTALALVDRAAALGVDIVQIGDNLPLGRLSPAELDALKARAAGHAISLEVGTADHHLAADEVVTTLRGIMARFEQAGVALAIENHDRFGVAMLVEILQRRNSPATGICLDIVNSFGALEGPKVVVEALAPWTLNLHVKDFVVRRVSHSMGFTVEGRPAGQGQLDIPWLLEQLHMRRRDCNAILELWTPPGPTVAETIIKEHEWAQASVAYLRQLIPTRRRAG